LRHATTLPRTPQSSSVAPFVTCPIPFSNNFSGLGLSPWPINLATRTPHANQRKHPGRSGPTFIFVKRDTPVALPDNSVVVGAVEEKYRVAGGVASSIRRDYVLHAAPTRTQISPRTKIDDVASERGQAGHARVFKAHRPRFWGCRVFFPNTEANTRAGFVSRADSNGLMRAEHVRSPTALYIAPAIRAAGYMSAFTCPSCGRERPVAGRGARP